MKQLARFAVSLHSAQHFVLSLEDEAGGRTELAAGPYQLDIIIQAVDAMLSEHEDAFLSFGNIG